MLDSETAKALGGTILAALGTATAWLYKGTHARIRKVEAEVATKAETKELDRQREHIVKLFEKHEDLRTDMNGGFTAIRADMHKMHLDIIDRLGR